jgi:hypothetical protein
MARLGRRLTPVILLVAVSACGGGAPEGGSGSDPGAEAAEEAPTTATAGERFVGEFRYMADAALFRPCDSERGMPVTGPAYLELERAYLEVRPGPGEPVLVEVEGSIVEQAKMEGEGTEPALAVTRIIRLDPSLSCPTASPS